MYANFLSGLFLGILLGIPAGYMLVKHFFPWIIDRLESKLEHLRELSREDDNVQEKD